MKIVECAEGKINYVSPLVECVEVKVEQGFAGSSASGGSSSGSSSTGGSLDNYINGGEIEF